MAWYNSAIHAVGNVVGPAAVGLGTVEDYLTPGKGSGTLTDVGHAITSGSSTANNFGAINPFVRGSVFSVAPSPTTGGGSTTQQSQPQYQGGGDQTGGTYSQGQYYNPYTGSYTSSAPSGPSASDLAQYDLAIGQYENQLPSIDRQLGIAQGNVNTQYGQKNNELQSAYDSAHNQYNQNTTQNQQQFVSNKNQVRDTASAGLRGLLRTLGAYGGGGTDADYARNVVAQSAARQNSGAGETFGQNQQGLDTSWGTYGIQHGNEQKQLDDWRTQQLNSAEQTSLTTKQSVLNTLANLRAQRAGGNTATATQALQDANGLQTKIDSLGALNPTYTGQASVYKAPDVASYTVNPNAQVQVAQNANDSLTSPWLNSLLGKDKKQQAQQYAPAF